MKNFLVFSAALLVAILIALTGLELVLENMGYGVVPLYQYDPVIGYLLKPSQELLRRNGARVFVNNFGMRSNETTLEKPMGVYRVLVLGDSVPFAGSYIDQKDTFCSVAESVLQSRGAEYEILNAGVNAYGPQNIQRYVEQKGLFDSNMVIVYLPWGNLRRDFTNYYILPFWSNNPKLALAELFRLGMWYMFGQLSRRWKNLDAFDNEKLPEMNIAALHAVYTYCQTRGTPIFFFWSPYMDVLMGTGKDKFASDRAKLLRYIPEECIVDVTPVFKASKDIPSLYVDDVHYSREGHLLVGKFLADFVRKHFTH
jgi:hypothetical protein